MQRMFNVSRSIHKVTNLLYRVLFGSYRLLSTTEKKIPYLLLYFMHESSFLRVSRNTEWPKEMYTLFTHQYLWNKFK